MTKFKLNKPTVPTFNKQLVIKVLVVLAVLVLVAVLVSQVADSWSDKQKQKDAQATQQRVDAAKTAADNQAKLDHAAVVEAAYNKLYVQCTKGASLYDNVLTATQRKINIAQQPVCGPAEVPKN